MDRLIYTALTGLTARSREQLVTANNLANAQVPGFRRELVVQEGRYLAARQASAGAHAARAQAGAPTLSTPADTGKVLATGRALDVALAGDAWLAVQGPVVGGRIREAYTRRGDLQLSPAGLVTNGDGRVVVNDAGAPLSAPPGAAIIIAEDGSVAADLPEGPVALGKLKLVNGAALNPREKTGDGLFLPEEPLPVDPSARLAPGALETANVSTAQALVELVEEQRGFEVNARLLRLAQDMDEQGARLLRLSN
jgi:flagellar basal-body rod protein FlgF